MSEVTVPVAPLRFRGHSSQYVDVAARGDERLAVAVEYAVHPSNVGCFILRFVAHGPVDPKGFKHLTYRESAKFLIPATDKTSAEVFKGLRLNKLALPALKPAVQRHEVDQHAMKFGLWTALAEWVTAQALAEGFTLLLTPGELSGIVRESVALPVTAGEVENVFQVPDLTAPEHKAAALKLVQKPEPDEDEEDDSEDEDGDEDEKEWLN